ncbi:hypothetical protein FB451DRAFT_1565043 [Mycena latifolia]|nr:hypothetical protein FB451DRAFT_1565043 [Mycena latifolia]
MRSSAWCPACPKEGIRSNLFADSAASHAHSTISQTGSTRHILAPSVMSSTDYLEPPSLEILDYILRRFRSRVEINAGVLNASHASDDHIAYPRALAVRSPTPQFSIRFLCVPRAVIHVQVAHMFQDDIWYIAFYLALHVPLIVLHAASVQRPHRAPPHIGGAQKILIISSGVPRASVQPEPFAPDAHRPSTCRARAPKIWFNSLVVPRVGLAMPVVAVHQRRAPQTFNKLFGSPAGRGTTRPSSRTRRVLRALTCAAFQLDFSRSRGRGRHTISFPVPRKGGSIFVACWSDVMLDSHRAPSFHPPRHRRYFGFREEIRTALVLVPSRRTANQGGTLQPHAHSTISQTGLGHEQHRLPRAVLPGSKKSFLKLERRTGLELALDDAYWLSRRQWHNSRSNADRADHRPRVGVGRDSRGGAMHAHLRLKDRERAVDASRSTSEKSDSATPHAASAGAPHESAGWCACVARGSVSLGGHETPLRLVATKTQRAVRRQNPRRVRARLPRAPHARTVQGRQVGASCARSPSLPAHLVSCLSRPHAEPSPARLPIPYYQSPCASIHFYLPTSSLTRY